jgi:hypothetical protein
MVFPGRLHCLMLHGVAASTGASASTTSLLSDSLMQIRGKARLLSAGDELLRPTWCCCGGWRVPSGLVNAPAPLS